MAHVVPGVGVTLPIFIPPFAAAFISVILTFRKRRYAPTLAYVSGTLGTLIGADLLNLPRIAEAGAKVASIGGAGTFDGIYLTGIIAALLA